MSVEVSEASIEVTALSVDEAIILGLTRLGLTRDEVEIEILAHASKGFLGLGARRARVRLTQRAPEAPLVELEPQPLSAAPVAKEAQRLAEPVIELEMPVAADVELQVDTPTVAEPAIEHAPVSVAPATTVVEATPIAVAEPEVVNKISSTSTLDRALLESMALDVTEHLFPNLSINVSTRWRREDRPTLWVSLHGADANMLVGPRAQTLNAVQYLFRTLIHHEVDGNYNIVIDADGYRKRRRNSLESLAHKKVHQALDTGRTIRLRPMPANERRLIHVLLRKDNRVKTASVGRGSSRAITIIPVKKSR